MSSVYALYGVETAQTWVVTEDDHPVRCPSSPGRIDGPLDVRDPVEAGRLAAAVHRGQGMHALRGVEGSQDIEIERGAGRRLGVVQRRAGTCSAGVVDEHVDVSELGGDGGEGGADGFPRAQVGGDEAADAPGR